MDAAIVPHLRIGRTQNGPEDDDDDDGSDRSRQSRQPPPPAVALAAATEVPSAAGPAATYVFAVSSSFTAASLFIRSLSLLPGCRFQIWASFYRQPFVVDVACAVHRYRRDLRGADGVLQDPLPNLVLDFFVRDCPRHRHRLFRRRRRRLWRHRQQCVLGRHLGEGFRDAEQSRIFYGRMRRVRSPYPNRPRLRCSSSSSSSSRRCRRRRRRRLVVIALCSGGRRRSSNTTFVGVAGAVVVTSGAIYCCCRC